MRTFQRSLVLSAVLALLLIAPSAASALTQADLDPSYGVAGTATPALPTIASGFTVAAQPDGKIVGGFTAAGNVPVAFRLNTDGSLDSSFGTGGTVNLATLGATSINVDRVLVAADGTIYLVGDGLLVNRRDAVWALTAAGAPKLGFNGTGSILLPVISASDNDIGDATLTPSGDVAVIAQATPGADDGLSLRVVTPNGAVTTNVTKVFAGYDASPISISVLPDGRFLVAVTIDGVSEDYGGLMTFSAAGVYDATFAGSGLAIFGPPIPLLSIPFKAFPLGDRIAGLGMVGYAPAIGIYSSTGSPIPEIGSNGVNRLLPPGASFAFTVDGGPVAAGRLVGVGIVAGSMSPLPYIVRYNADGTPDASFAPGGLANVPSQGGGFPAFARQPDGKYIVAVGLSDGRLSLVRMWGDVPAPPAPQAATVKFSSSVKSKQKASKAKRFAGTAGGTGVSKVELAIQKVDSKLLKKSKKCTYVKSTSAKLKNYKAVKGKCAPGVWLRAKGTGAWSVKLSKALKPGKYVLSARSTGVLGLSSVVTKSITLSK